MKRPLETHGWQPGDRIEVVRKGQVRAAGELHRRRMIEDASPYSSAVEVVELDLDGLGRPAFSRQISARGHAMPWGTRARDMRRIGTVRLRRADPAGGAR